MKTDEIIGQIRAACPWISTDQILNRLGKEKRKTGGFISDETLLSMIAAEFGCVISKDKKPTPSLWLADLIPGLNDVTAVGRVLVAFPPKTFGGARKGKFASVLIADKTCILRVVLWNDKAGLFERGEMKVGQVVRFSHGYTRESLGGKVELSVGEKCEVEINPKDAKAKDYPGIRRFSTEIAEVDKSHGGKRLNIVGTVRRVFPPSTFERKDGTRGRVMRFVLSDRTGEVPVVVWNEKAEELEKTLKVGDELQVVNGKSKKALAEGSEVHVDAATYVGPLAQFEEFLNVADLREERSQVNVEGEVVTKPFVRDVKTGRGEVLKLASFELRDETGGISVSAWRRHADTAANLRIGDKVVIRKGVVKKGFGDQLEISTRNATSIDVVEP
jgi:replication factor A1